MKVRNNPTGENFQEEFCSFDEIIPCDFEKEESKQLPIKKVLVATIMAISVGMVMMGVSNIQKESEVYQAVKIEDSNWSDFDTSKFDSYFNILSAGSEYKILEAMCSNGSTVYSTIKNNENDMQYLYDEHYGIAQGFQKFGRYISINHINGVSNNAVSLSINYVSEDDLVEFFNANSNDLCRYFTSHEISKENMVRELFSLLDTYKISTSEIVIELPVEKVDGLYTIADDSEICDLLSNTYNKAIDEMIKQISLH